MDSDEPDQPWPTDAEIENTPENNWRPGWFWYILLVILASGAVVWQTSEVFRSRTDRHEIDAHSGYSTGTILETQLAVIGGRGRPDIYRILVQFATSDGQTEIDWMDGVTNYDSVGESVRVVYDTDKPLLAYATNNNDTRFGRRQISANSYYEPVAVLAFVFSLIMIADRFRWGRRTSHNNR